MRTQWQLGVFLAALASCSCVPWTVRPIETTTEQKGLQERFNAVSYVDSIWDSRVVPTVMKSAVDLSTLPKDADGRNYMVRGQAKVLRVDSASAWRVVSVDLLPGDGKPDAVIQIGPVVRGTALRDSVGFIQFGQFANQIDFADVSNALNERAVARAVSPSDITKLAGRTVEFYGAFTAAKGQVPQIVPVKLDVLPESR
jgi:predicted lipoprotein